MSNNSETIISEQTHIGDSSVQEFVGQPFKGDGFYGRADGFHTIQTSLTGFRGRIVIQATLSTTPEEVDWITIDSRDYVLDGSTNNETGNDTPEKRSEIINFTGNYVWVRAKIVNWTDGTVNKIQLNH